MRLKAVIGAAFLAVGAWVIPMPAGAQDIAPDNNTAAIPWSGQIQSINLQTGVLSAVPNAEEGLRAKWSPNGRYLVFVTRSGETSVRLYDTKTNATRVLGGNLSFSAAWREDSGRLAFFHTPPTGKNELIEYAVGEKGITMRVNIAVLPHADAPMVWLPTTDNIAYVGNDENIYSVEEGETKRITTSNDVIGLGLSGDQKSLLWARRGPNLKYILVSFYSYDLKSRSVRRIEFPGQVPGINPNPRQAPVSIEDAVFSPDGTRIALVVTLEKSTTPPQPKPKRQEGDRPTLSRRPTPNPRMKAVFVVRIDGTGAREIASSTATATVTPFWSRDSKTAAVLRTDSPSNALILADADGGNVRAVLGSAK